MGLPRRLSFNETTRVLSGKLLESQVRKRYIYRATDSRGAAAERNFTINVNPAIPANLEAFGGEGRVTLTWDDPNDAGITFWAVQMSGVWVPVPTTQITTTAPPKVVARFGGLNNGRTYQYKVRGVTEDINQNGNLETRSGAPSDSVSGTPGANTPPVISGGSTVNIDVSELALVGSDIGGLFSVTDANRDLITWRLEEENAGDDAAPFSIRKTSFLQSRLSLVSDLDYETKTSYTFELIANDSFADSGPVTVTVNVIDVSHSGDTPVTSITDAPTVSSETSASLSVVWAKPQNSGRPPITGYDVRYCRISSNCDHKQRDASEAGYQWTHAAHTGTMTSMTIGGLSGGAEYEVQVRAKSVNGVAAWSESGVWTAGMPPELGDLPAHDAPIVWAVTSNSLGVAWSMPAHDGPAVTGYRIAHRKYQKGVPTQWFYYDISGTDTAAIIREFMQRGTVYQIRVRAQSDTVSPPVDSPWSEPTLGKTRPNSPPFYNEPPPQVVQLPPGYGSSAAGTSIFSVSASDSDGDNISYGLSGEDAGMFTISSGGQVYTAAYLSSEEQTYAFSVQADDGHGGTATATVTVTVTNNDDDANQDDANDDSTNDDSTNDDGNNDDGNNDDGNNDDEDGANAPAITDVRVSHPATATLGETVVVTVAATGDVAAAGKPYRWVRQSDGSSWSTDSSSRTFQGWPTSPGTRSWEVFVTGSDGVEYSSGVFSITWEEPAAPPQDPAAITDVSVSHPATATVGDDVTVTVSVTGDVAASGKPYRWVRALNGNEWRTDSPSRTFHSWWPTSPGTRAWEVFVTGSDGVEYASGQFSITWEN